MSIQTATEAGVEAPRLDLATVAPKQIAALIRVGRSVDLDPGLAHPDKLRHLQSPPKTGP
jgi:hypothetical protein